MFSSDLADKGLNLQAVFNINKLPSEILARLSDLVDELADYKHLIVFAHGGKLLWQQLKESPQYSEDPIDTYSESQIRQYFSTAHPSASIRFLYPGNDPVQLQTFGELAGWHFKSPFMVGINDVWGSWYAYRAVVLTDLDSLATQQLGDHVYQPPCDSCEGKPCIEACPPKAVSESGLDMSLCIRYRKSENSECKVTCLARVNCPIGTEHRYSDEQIKYHYQCSLDTIVKLY